MVTTSGHVAHSSHTPPSRVPVSGQPPPPQNLHLTTKCPQIDHTSSARKATRAKRHTSIDAKYGHARGLKDTSSPNRVVSQRSNRPRTRGRHVERKSCSIGAHNVTSSTFVTYTILVAAAVPPCQSPHSITRANPHSFGEEALQSAKTRACQYQPRLSLSGSSMSDQVNHKAHFVGLELGTVPC